MAGVAPKQSKERAMQVEPWLNAQDAHVHGSQVKCPLCEWKLIRLRRRPVDRLWSLVHPLKRYRCENFRCQWMGNIATTRIRKAPAAAIVNTRLADYTQEQHPRRVPVAFIVHMVLVAVGVVFVFVYSRMEPTSHVDGNATALIHQIYEWTAGQPDTRVDSR